MASENVQVDMPADVAVLWRACDAAARLRVQLESAMTGEDDTHISDAIDQLIGAICSLRSEIAQRSDAAVGAA